MDSNSALEGKRRLIKLDSDRQYKNLYCKIGSPLEEQLGQTTNFAMIDPL
jgi:hypothetical protein